MSLLSRFRRPKQDPEIARRSMLRRSGRLGEATVQDSAKDETGATIVNYIYNIGGAEYESSQSIDPDQSQRERDCLPGTRIAIRYDPHRPSNSVVV
jgi:hypothetical protein